MGKDMKFFGIVSMLIVAFLGMLAGGMHLINAKGDTVKDLDEKENIEIILNSEDREKYFQSIVQVSTYEEMQKKFSDMQSISTDGKTITVISDKALELYWKIHDNLTFVDQEGTNLAPKGWSLSTDEVLYLIQESSGIFREYETIILPNDPEKLGWLSGAVIKPKEWLMYTGSGNIYVNEYIGVYYLTYARAKVLSSPEAFVSFNQKDRLISEGYYSECMDWDQNSTDYFDLTQKLVFSFNEENFEYYITSYELNTFYSESKEYEEIKKKNNLTALFWFNPDFYMRSSIMMESERRRLTSAHNCMDKKTLTAEQEAAMESIKEREIAAGTGLLQYERALVSGDIDEGYPRMTLQEVESIIEAKKNIAEVVKAIIYRQPYPDLGNGTGDARAIYYFEDGESGIIISESPKKTINYFEKQTAGTVKSTVLLTEE